MDEDETVLRQERQLIELSHIPLFSKRFASILYFEPFDKFIDRIADHFHQPDLLAQTKTVKMMYF